MLKSHFIGTSVIALSTAVGSAPALAITSAARTVSVNVADYNAAQVATAEGNLTVPAGLATYTVTSGSLEINSRFTVTLPTGFSFASQPVLTATGDTRFTLATGGIGSQSTTFVVGTAPLAADGTAALQSFAIQGATALETPIPVAAALPISLQSTNNAEIDNNDPAPISKPAFASEPGGKAVFVGAIQFIDLSSPTLGTQFGVGSDTTTIVLSAFALAPETQDPVAGKAVLSPDGFTNTLSTHDTATVTISGLFEGVQSAFLANDSDCATSATIEGSAGTVTPTQLIFTQAPENQEVFACLRASGTTLLRQNRNGFALSVAPGSSTDFLGFDCPPGSCNEFPGLWTYFGGGILSVSNFFTGDDSGYASLLRVNNAGNGPVDLFALVQPDTGGAPLSGSLGSLGNGAGTVFSEAQVAAATGLSLANSGQRATVQLIVSGDYGAVVASTFLVNPGGAVDNVGLPKRKQ